ncbi:MAG: chorismate mutase [Shewanellaceae bacterium]|nr:chorismate mutase [Shewanellaceae bacterium]
MKTAAPELLSLREAIESIDTDILKLCHKRQQTAAKIARVKQNLNLPTRDLNREEAYLKMLKQQAQPELSAKVIQDLMILLMSASVDLQDLKRSQTLEEQATHVKCDK